MATEGAFKVPAAAPVPILRVLSALIDTAPELTVPSSSMVKLAVPRLPTVKLPVEVQMESVPLTVASPTLLAALAMIALVLVTSPPARTFIVPVPKSPTRRKPLFCQVESAPVMVAVPFPAEPTALVKEPR